MARVFNWADATCRNCNMNVAHMHSDGTARVPSSRSTDARPFMHKVTVRYGTCSCEWGQTGAAKKCYHVAIGLAANDEALRARVVEKAGGELFADLVVV